MGWRELTDCSSCDPVQQFDKSNVLEVDENLPVGCKTSAREGYIEQMRHRETTNVSAIQWVVSGAWGNLLDCCIMMDRLELQRKLLFILANPYRRKANNIT